MSDIQNPYADLYTNPKGPGDARPTAQQIIHDHNAVNSLVGKVILMTGATSGIGLETLRALHTTGADIYVAVQDVNDAKLIAADILDSSEGMGKIEILEMEMASLESVKKAAQAFLSMSDKLHILVNNAGVMGKPADARSAEGFELQFAINHLAHFTLTALLIPTMIRSSTPSFNSRVIAVASTSHRYSAINWEDVNLTGKHDPWVAYGQSKTANIWMANYIDRVYGSRGVHAHSIFPGLIWTPMLVQHLSTEEQEQWKSDASLMNLFQSPKQGAATTVWASIASSLEGQGGKFLAHCGLGVPAKDMLSIFDPGYAPYAYYEEGENRLWELSCQLTGVKVEE